MRGCGCWLQTFEEAVAMNNSVPQGLSSSLFTTDMKKVFKWMGCVTSSCHCPRC